MVNGTASSPGPDTEGLNAVSFACGTSKVSVLK